MANSRRPSFLKRQKEQKRLAKALEKREARLARKRPQEETPQSEQAESAEPVVSEEEKVTGDGQTSPAPGAVERSS